VILVVSISAGLAWVSLISLLVWKRRRDRRFALVLDLFGKDGPDG
jgi:hypothetical protein